MITFTTPSSAPISYLQADAQRLLALIGKDENAPQGIITAAQLPAAKAAIEQAIAREEAQAQPPQNGPEPDDEPNAAADATGNGFAPIALRRRALPLLRLLDAAIEAGDAIVWQA